MRPRLKNHPPGTHSLVYKTNSTFIVSTIIDLRFFPIDHTAFPQAPYKLTPSINNIFTCASFFSLFLILSLFLSFIFIVHFFVGLWGLGGACVNPGSFFQILFLCIHLFVQQLTYFLMDFSQTFISTSPMYALPVILFSACKKHLNLFVIGCYTAD